MTTASGWVLLFAMSALASLPIYAADRVQFQTSGDLAPDEKTRPDVLFHAAQVDSAVGFFDPHAEELLRSAERFTKDVFRLPTLKFIRAITYTNGAGDNMLVEWSFDEPFGSGFVFLRDEPFISQYQMRLNGISLLSAEELSLFLTALVIWEKPPVSLGGTTVYLPSSYSKVGIFWAQPPPPFSEVALIHDFNVLGIHSNQDTYLTVQVGKSFTKSYYPVPPFVPERFPSLNELVRLWDSRRIWDEIGKPTEPSARYDLTEVRDSILITELAGRGLSKDEFVNLLRNGPSARLYSRASTVFQSLEKAGQGAEVGRYFEPMLDMYRAIGSPAAAAVNELFRVLVKRTDCTVPFEGRALRLLSEGVFQEGAMTYLRNCSTSMAAIHGIETASVPDTLLPLKELSLRSVRNRLGKNEQK